MCREHTYTEFTACAFCYVKCMLNIKHQRYRMNSSSACGWMYIMPYVVWLEVTPWHYFLHLWGLGGENAQLSLHRQPAYLSTLRSSAWTAQPVCLSHSLSRPAGTYKSRERQRWSQEDNSTNILRGWWLSTVRYTRHWNTLLRGRYSQ